MTLILEWNGREWRWKQVGELGGIMVGTIPLVGDRSTPFPKLWKQLGLSDDDMESWEATSNGYKVNLKEVNVMD